MKVHLVDGTYELFRQHFGSARGSGREPGEFDATIGVLTSTLQLLEDGATHVGVASDHVIESFRNELWDGYKTSEGMLPELLDQIPVMEDALMTMGVTTWAMVEWEADDALGAAAHVADRDERVEQVLIVTPDKDLGQCVKGRRVVQYDRRKREIIDEDAVREKFGVGPESIPDYLGLVGDTADGFPGLPGWGAKSASKVLGRYGHLEDIPPEASLWDVDGLRGAAKLAATLREQMELAVLFRIIATVDRDVPVGTVDDWRWTGPTDGFEAFVRPAGCPRFGHPRRRTRRAPLTRRRDRAGAQTRWASLARSRRRASSTSAIRPCLASARTRASQYSMGTASSTWTASRTASIAWERWPSKGLTAITNGTDRASK